MYPINNAVERPLHHPLTRRGIGVTELKAKDAKKEAQTSRLILGTARYS